MPKGKKKGKKDEEAALEAERQRKEAEEAAAREAEALAQAKAKAEAEEAERREAAERARRERPFKLIVRTRCLPFCLAPTAGAVNVELTARQVDKVASVKRQLAARTRASQKVVPGRIVLAFPPARGASESWKDMENDATLFDYGVEGAGGGAGRAAPVLRLSLRELSNEQLLPAGPASVDSWRYSALDRSLVRTAPKGSVFDERMYEEEMSKLRAAGSGLLDGGAAGASFIGEDAAADAEGFGESGSEEEGSGDDEDAADAAAARQLPSNNHELLQSLTLRTQALGEAAADSDSASDPVRALRDCIAFQKRRRQTEKILR
eukprot:g456.t1